MGQKVMDLWEGKVHKGKKSIVLDQLAKIDHGVYFLNIRDNQNQLGVLKLIH